MTGIHGWTQLDFCAFIISGDIIESGVNLYLDKLFQKMINEETAVNV
jgi:hypothetical protein